MKKIWLEVRNTTLSSTEVIEVTNFIQMNFAVQKNAKYDLYELLRFESCHWTIELWLIKAWTCAWKWVERIQFIHSPDYLVFI